MRWLHVERSGMWFMAVDDTGDVWGCSADSAIHACAEARRRRAAGQLSLSQDWFTSYGIADSGIDKIQITATFTCK